MNDILHAVDDWGPEKVVCVSDRRSGMRGVLVIDNTARGMGKGGTRMGPNVTVEEIARLARTMTWKWAASNLYFGGAKAGLLGDAQGPRKEEQLRAFARALRNEVPSEYVFGLDMGLNETDAAILADELGDRGAAVGMPASLGGLPYDQLGITGYGVVEAADAAAGEIGLDFAASRIAIQGFGAVGVAAARRCNELGATVVAVATAAGSVADQNGLDLQRLLELQVKLGDACVLEYGGSTDADAVLREPTDVFIPAAREDTVDEAVVEATTAKLVVEGANMPLTAGARAVLHRRGISVVPDFIANAGGIVAAAHSMEARTSPFTVDPDHVLAMVSTTMRGNAVTVIRESLAENIAPHDAAWRMAEARVRSAMAVRGQISSEEGNL